MQRTQRWQKASESDNTTRRSTCPFWRPDSNNNNNNNDNNNNKAEKILKYKDLIIEIQRMWNVKTKVTPVIIGATGTISKSFRKHLSSIPGKHDIKELQKTAILGTAHTLRKVLM
jgi:hypothetical protein